MPASTGPSKSRTRQPLAKLKLMFKEQHTLMMLLKEFRDGIMICDEAGQVLQVNRSLKSLLHLKADITGQRAIEVVKDPQFKVMLQSVMNTGTTVVEELRVTLPAVSGVSGSTVDKFFELHAVPIFIPEEKSPYEKPPADDAETASQEVTGCIFIFHDITEIRHTEKMRRDFVANVSHELRTPLSAIEGYSETLLNGALEDDAVRRDFVEVIYNHSLRLTRLVEDLLDLSKLESPDYKPELRPVSILDEVTRTVSMILPKAAEKQILISTDIKSSVPKVLADPNGLDQVLTNLLDNAVKYTPINGRVTLRVFENERGQVQVDVKDTGMGIEAKYLPRIFERFYRVDKARSRELGGTGLGLAIVKHIMQLLGGEIWVDSKVNEGTTFSFTLDKADKA